MPWYALCSGADLSICNNCRRNVANQQAAVAPQQTFLSPVLRGRHCAHWMAPASTMRAPANAAGGAGKRHG